MVGQFFIIYPWFEWDFNFLHCLWALVFNFLVGMIYYTYYLACSTDPGGVPDPGLFQPEILSNLVEPRDPIRKYCHKCNNYKPPRAHHCSMCNRCILRMDHVR